MAGSKSRVFCPACGLQVEPALGMEAGYKTIHCSICDLLLESTPDASANPNLMTPDLATPARGIKAVKAMLNTVIVADDAQLVREQLTGLLAERKIAQKVLPAATGEELLIQFHRCVASGHAPDLVISDVHMPVLNGINAAIGIRAAERAAQIAAPVPILFFTSTQCDESFKRVLEFTKPSRYLNKGAPAPPQEFAERLVQVLLRLLNPGPGPVAPA